MERRTILGLGVGLAVAGPVQGAPAGWPPAEHVALWPGLPPGAPAALPQYAPSMNGPGGRQLWVRGVAVPELNVFRPARPDGSALLVLPGGGYGFLSVQNEGLDAAARFNPPGLTLFVLSYRLPQEGWANQSVVPLQDAQRAMRLIRGRASQYGIDPDRLGVMGFSAGGHLAAELAVHAGEEFYEPVDAADGHSAVPAFAALIYPAITLAAGGTHSATADNLLGRDAAAALRQARSPYLHVTRAMPRCFIVHATDDPTVPVNNSLLMLQACLAAQVPVEAHLLEHGGHGFGFSLPANSSGALWPELFLRWRGFNPLFGRRDAGN